MAPPKSDKDPLPCPSWIFSTGTNVHVAKDRSWFADDYTSIESFIEGRFGDQLPVIDIGTVNLPTKVAAKKTGLTSHGTLRLENVLHVPSALCNIVGTPIFDPFTFSFSSRAFTDPATGRQVAYCKPDTTLLEIRLGGPPVGLPKQLRWIKGDYGSSVNFMLSYGLTFYKDEDCEEAQAIANALTMDDSDDSDADFTDSEHSFQEPVLETNYLFSPKQVQWLERKYGSTQNFMVVQKLNAVLGSDCDDARIRAKALMAEAGLTDDDSDAFWVEEDDTQNNATDRLFSPLELRYVRCWYISSKNYMAIFGYDVAVEADCKMGQASIQSEMKSEVEMDGK
ncbi:unnamed protein product [Clonostachys rhizophaga]|uniref:Retrovirus-related Pol polyprotein from transposon TNT 1-94-like beta-barrel domain-containing protein n=1 Tax=Clonostachys rhizophaga TaxID=160324 RepID=A0A9N9VZ40_9HYPO|nr:unnamed protein product [Clonostachys rhizophaga]